MKHQIEYRQQERYPYRCMTCLLTWKNEPSSECVGKPCYYWQQSPEHFQTFSQLRALHLKPRDRAQADAYLWCQETWTPLYDQRIALPRRQQTERQQEARRLSWQKTQEKYTCQDCSAKPGNLADLKRFTPGLCRACLAQHAWWDKLDQDHRDAILLARQLLARQDAALIDTETTDLDGVVLEVAVIALDGTVLFESLVNPECPVSPDAYERHRISDQELATAPTLPEIWPGLMHALSGYRLLLAYNADFDEGILVASARRYNLAVLPHTWRCLMRLYAMYVGEWSDHWGNYRWQPLGGNHRALGDARAAWGVLLAMASAPEDEPSPTRVWEEKEVARARRLFANQSRPAGE